MSLLIITIMYLLCIMINSKLLKSVYNSFFFVMTPYYVVIMLNNLLFVKKGFFYLDDRYIYVHSIAFLIFEIGVLFGHSYAAKYKFVIFHTKRQEIYDIRKTEKAIIACELVVALSYLRIYLSGGISALISGGGVHHLAAHLNILMTILSIVMLKAYIELRCKRYLFHVVITLVFQAMSFIKYHVIVVIISYFVFLVIKDKRNMKKFTPLLVILVVAFFCVNYLISFISMGVTIGSSFYINHFWAYVAGGTINMQNFLQAPPGLNLSLGKWLWSCIASFPQMFANVFGVQLFSYDFVSAVPEYFLGGSTSNVLSIISTVYVQANQVVWGIFMLIWAIISEISYVRSKDISNETGLILVTVFMSYNFLSFFSCFFSLSSPWESMCIAMISGHVLRKKEVGG